MIIIKWKWVLWCVVVVLLIGFGVLIGYGLWEAETATTLLAVDVPLDVTTLEEEGYLSGSVIEHQKSDTLERELIERLIDGLKSAEVHIEYDQSGYSRGVITLYWER